MLRDLSLDETWVVCDLILNRNIDINSSAHQFCNVVWKGTMAPCADSHVR